MLLTNIYSRTDLNVSFSILLIYKGCKYMLFIICTKFSIRLFLRFWKSLCIEGAGKFEIVSEIDEAEKFGTPLEIKYIKHIQYKQIPVINSFRSFYNLLV